MLTRAALKNPYAVFALCMIALVLGAVSYQKMRVDIFPEIKIPTILVTTFYRGMSPSEMEGAITLRMEQRFVEASYVEHIESQSLAGHELYQGLLSARIRHRRSAIGADQSGLQHHPAVATGRLSALRLQVRRRQPADRLPVH